jgi:hypothetical protein
VCEGQVVFGTRRAGLGNDDVIAHSSTAVGAAAKIIQCAFSQRSRKRPVMHQGASNSLKRKRIARCPSKRHELRDEQSRDYMFRAWACGAAQLLAPRSSDSQRRQGGAARFPCMRPQMETAAVDSRSGAIPGNRISLPVSSNVN